MNIAQVLEVADKTARNSTGVFCICDGVARYGQ